MTRALVRRGVSRAVARRAFSVMPYGRYVRAGARIYNTGRRFAPFARAAIAAFAARRKRKRSMTRTVRLSKRMRTIGHSRYDDSTKKQQEKYAAESGPRRTYGVDQIYAWDLTKLAADKNNDGVHDINDRLHDAAYFAGVKLCSLFSHLTSETTPLHINMAIVAPKGFSVASNLIQSEFATASVASTPGFDARFFRDFRNNGTRASDYTEPTLTPNERHCLNINPDRYRVFNHQRFTINPKNSNAGHYGYARKDMYIPIKRQIRYGKDGTGVEGDQVFMIVWAGYVNDPDVAAGDDLGIEMKMIKYFTDIKN